MLAFAPRSGAWTASAASPSLNSATAAIFVANFEGCSGTTSYPTGASGNVAPISEVAPTLCAPEGVAVNSKGNIYVANTGTNTVTVYPAGSNGNVAPIATIGGSNTGLSDPQGIALDASGNIYVTNSGSEREGYDTVTVYPAGSNGNVAPSSTIEGSNIGLSDPQGIALDASGNIYVTNDNGSGSVTVYPAGSNGSVMPMWRIAGSNTGLSKPDGIALDASGNIYVANSLSSEGINTVTVYPTGSSGDIAPSSTIVTGFGGPQGIALDAKGNIYVTNATSTVTIYPAGSSGNVTPSSTVGGSNTGLGEPAGIALDASGNIYVTNSGSGSESTDTVTIYSAGSNGNVAPNSTIGSFNAGLDGPQGIALDASGNIYVANASNSTVTVYPAGSNGSLAPIRTIGGSNTGLNHPTAIALDASSNIYVTNSGSEGGGTDTVTIYPAGSNGNVTPSSTIGGSNTGLSEPAGVALDASSNIYVTNSGSGSGGTGTVTVYRAGSSGSITPSSTIGGSNTGLGKPAGIALNASGDIYVANEYGNTVTGYPAGSNGNVAPRSIIGGSNTSLSGPFGVALDASGSIYVANLDSDTVTVYPAGSNGDVTPSATVAGPATELYEPEGIAIGPEQAPAQTATPTASATPTPAPTPTPATPTPTATQVPTPPVPSTSATPTSSPTPIPLGGKLSLSTHTLAFGAIKTGKSHKLSFTIKNTAKTTLQGNVDDSGVLSPLSVINGAGPFSLGKNKVQKVTVEAAPTEAGPFSATIAIHSGDPKHLIVSVTAKGRAKK